MKQDPTYEDVRALVLSELDTALSAVDPQSVEQLMEAVLSSRKVFFVGVGRVLLSLEAMAKRWAHLGIDTHIVGEITEPPEAGHTKRISRGIEANKAMAAHSITATMITVRRMP